jgi:hypothetical protein
MSTMLAKANLKRRAVLNEGRRRTAALAATIGLAACSSPSDGPGCVGDGVECGTPVTGNGPVVAPTCSTATPPVALGGTYDDGTYVLTTETLYQSGNCVPPPPVSQTLVIAGDCEEWAATNPTDPDAGVNSGSTSFVVQGNQMTACGVGTEAFTATATTLTFFYPCGGGDQECVSVDVYAKQ